MVHAFATLCFTVIAAGGAALIWAMLVDNRAAIVAALGMAPAVTTTRIETRRIRVRSVQPAVALRRAQQRRAA